MKRQLPLFLMLSLFISVTALFGQGFENFNNYAGTSGTYSNGSFTGQDGSTWNYLQCRSDKPIAVPSPCLGKGRNPTAKVESGSIAGGCGVLSFDFKQGFSSAANLNVYVNNQLVGNVTSPGGNGDTATIRNSGPIVVNASGNFILLFKQADSLLSGQVTVDNVTWTSYGGGTLPEPTNYPANFAASTAPFTINLAWVDATGAQAPTAYLILASDQNNVGTPVDGTPVSNDANLSDGQGALNVFQGVQSASFGNLPSNKQYFFKIFPYTNSGASINYKTDGTAPAANATTPNTVIIDSIYFTTYSFKNWILKSVSGAQEWVIDSIHGMNNGPCAKVTGYAGASNVNEDWLISPSYNFNQYNNERLTFQSAYKYTGPPLECLISNDYDGTSNPNDFTWTILPAAWSSGNWVWTPSGMIDISGALGNNIHIGFKYTSTATESSTWELDDIVVYGDVIIGLDENHSAATGFSVTPNPASGTCNLNFTAEGQKEISILSLVGKTVFETSTSQTTCQVNLSGFASGIYFIRVSSPDGNAAQVKKLVVR